MLNAVACDLNESKTKLILDDVLKYYGDFEQD